MHKCLLLKRLCGNIGNWRLITLTERVTYSYRVKLKKCANVSKRRQSKSTVLKNVASSVWVRQTECISSTIVSVQISPFYLPYLTFFLWPCVAAVKSCCNKEDTKTLSRGKILSLTSDSEHWNVLFAQNEGCRFWAPSLTLELSKFKWYHHTFMNIALLNFTYIWPCSYFLRQA